MIYTGTIPRPWASPARADHQRHERAGGVRLPSSRLGRVQKVVNIIWAGLRDDGLVHVTRDGGKNWTNVTPRDMPDLDASARSTDRPSIPAPRTSPSRSRCSTISRPTSSARTTSARPGRRIVTGMRRHDLRPGLAEIVRAEDVRRQVVEQRLLHRDVRRAGIERRRVDLADAAEVGHVLRRHVRPRLAAVARDAPRRRRPSRSR